MSSPTVTTELPSTSAARPAPAAAARRLVSPRYVAALGILAAMAVGTTALERVLGIHTRKEPVPLKKPLAAFDDRKLGAPWRRHVVQPPPISAEVQDSLGTDQYLTLNLVDESQSERSPTRVAHLFVTYYTGKPDMVPHVPDECMPAGGYDAIGASNHTVQVPGVGLPGDSLGIRAVQFRTKGSSLDGGGSAITVLYFFHVNGGTAITRDGVRLKGSNPFERHAYYSKIELHFTDDIPFQRLAGLDESLAAAVPLLQRVLPVLLEDHFDLSKFSSGAGRPPARRMRSRSGKR